MREIVVDNFAGGGGASTGIEIAIGRSVDIAINHDPAARNEESITVRRLARRAFSDRIILPRCAGRRLIRHILTS